MRAGTIVLPATHAGAPSGPAQAPPYGARLRLRANFPLDTLPNAGARTVARALQRYGMVLADDGNVALTARSDRYTQTKWAGLLEPHDLRLLKVTDFEMIVAGTRYPLTYVCERELPPVPRAGEVGALAPGDDGSASRSVREGSHPGRFVQRDRQIAAGIETVEIVNSRR